MLSCPYVKPFNGFLGPRLLPVVPNELRSNTGQTATLATQIAAAAGAAVGDLTKSAEFSSNIRRVLDTVQALVFLQPSATLRNSDSNIGVLCW